MARRRDEIIHEWLEIYSAHYGYELVAADVTAWQYGLSGVHPDDLKKAFIRTMKEVKNVEGFAVRPKVGDVLSRVEVDPTRDRKSGYLIPGRAGDCYQRDCPEDLKRADAGLSCGCIACAPQLYCRESGCTKLRMRHLMTRRLLNGCIDHAAKLDEEIKQTVAWKSEFQRKIDELAKAKSMPGEGDGVEEVHIP